MGKNSVYSFIKNNGSYPFHMPGHKRNQGLDKLTALGAWADITEIGGADDLHHPTGMLAELQTKLSRTWRSTKSYLLVNGSTCGNLAAMGALGKRGDKVLVARNCHRSVYHGLELFGYNPVFLTPSFVAELGVYGALEAEMVKDALLKHSDAAFLVLTSPTYEGIISNIREIAALCKASGVALLVDEAHGAHLDLSPYFSGGAVKAGADVVVQSMHKTLPALTPSAVLHVNGNGVDLARLEHYLRVFQTSSPSYPLMASVEACLEYLSTPMLFEEWHGLIKMFIKNVKGLSSIKLFKTDDPSKLVLIGKNGTELASFLRLNGVEAEYTTDAFVLAMTGAGDRAEGFKLLIDTLAEADRKLGDYKPIVDETEYCQGAMVATIEAALNAPKEMLDLRDCAGRTAAEYIWAYPPGIPLLVPGQTITAEFAGSKLSGCYSDNGSLPLVAVVKNSR